MKKLEGIKPFNKFSFRTCYYSQLIAGYAHYGLDERLIIMNYIPLYDKSDFPNYLTGLTIFTEKELEELSGIRLIKKKSVNDIVGVLIRAIDGGSPVIVAVDCYYLPYRADTYKKLHSSHFLLIYGYDKTKAAFIINDHNYINSIYYSEGEISFEDLKTACKEYIVGQKMDRGASFIKIKRTVKKEYVFSPEQYARAYMKNFVKAEESINNLLCYCEHIISLLSDKGKLDSEINEVVFNLIYIRMKKQIHKYQMAELFNDERINDMNYRSMDNFVFIYGLLLKIQMTNVFNEKIVEKLNARLRETIEIERNLNDIWRGKYHEILR